MFPPTTSTLRLVMGFRCLKTNPQPGPRSGLRVANQVTQYNNSGPIVHVWRRASIQQSSRDFARKKVRRKKNRHVSWLRGLTQHVNVWSIVWIHWLHTFFNGVFFICFFFSFGGVFLDSWFFALLYFSASLLFCFFFCFLLHCFSVFFASLFFFFSVSLLFCFSASLFSSFLLLCFSASLFFCFFASLLFCFSASLFFRFSASLLFCFSAFAFFVSLLFCFFLVSLHVCFSASLLLWFMVAFLHSFHRHINYK